MRKHQSHIPSKFQVEPPSQVHVHMQSLCWIKTLDHSFLQGISSGLHILLFPPLDLKSGSQFCLVTQTDGLQSSLDVPGSQAQHQSSCKPWIKPKGPEWEPTCHPVQHPSFFLGMFGVREAPAHPPQALLDWCMLHQDMPAHCNTWLGASQS